MAALLSFDVRADSLEGTNGTTMTGKIVARDDKFVTIEILVSGKPTQRKIPVNLVKAITVDGKREVLGPGGVAKPGAPAGNTGVQRSRPEIEALIASAATPPDWLDAVQLNLPKSLDLSWPEKAEGPWNNQKNMGQYIWDVINTNPSKWREGVRLMHHVMDQNKADREMQMRASAALAGMYHHLFQDYPHAAYWFRKAGTRQDPVGLAECYWKLGNKAMAVELLTGLRSIPPTAIKLWADMGETAKAIQTGELFAKSGSADLGYLYSADALRLAGRYKEALAYYNKVLAVPDDKRNKRSKDRAKGAIEAIQLFDTLDIAKVADGTYTSSSLGYEAPVEIEVKVAGGKIEALKVTKHREKQYYASITDTPARIIAKQSVKGIDATSRATITSEAIITATAKALQSGQK
ncbi:FMN-binding protein [Humisphaera borealis]|uniref:FMN-binding protein n=1 Tax=Humisphaera borealis TaxID=2807512 RepID=A0A7M2X1Y8_9BACT|nr:FMN-binding protein [Humisphaera borealis]QOV91723.1 FMN-binding protein [Humisphaera borealis]